MLEGLPRKIHATRRSGEPDRTDVASFAGQFRKRPSSLAMIASKTARASVGSPTGGPHDPAANSALATTQSHTSCAQPAGWSELNVHPGFIDSWPPSRSDRRTSGDSTRLRERVVRLDRYFQVLLRLVRQIFAIIGIGPESKWTGRVGLPTHPAIVASENAAVINIAIRGRTVRLFGHAAAPAEAFRRG
jgi:hypothetical protein